MATRLVNATADDTAQTLLSNLMNLELMNKTALISGPTKGIGFVIASQLGTEGTRLIVNG